MHGYWYRQNGLKNRGWSFRLLSHKVVMVLLHLVAWTIELIYQLYPTTSYQLICLSFLFFSFYLPFALPLFIFVFLCTWEKLCCLFVHHLIMTLQLFFNHTKDIVASKLIPSMWVIPLGRPYFTIFEQMTCIYIYILSLQSKILEFPWRKYGGVFFFK